MAESEELRITLSVIRVLDELNVVNHLGGSFASTIHGVPRQTRDADLVADLHESHIERLIEAVGAEFYVDGDMIRDAIERCSSFNLIHLGSGFKVDIFVMGKSEFDRLEMSRAEPVQIATDPITVIRVKSPEDTVLRKLLWYEMGGGVSDRQWNDIQGILRVHGDRLDRKYLREWSDRLGLSVLLLRALDEAQPPR